MKRDCLLFLETSSIGPRYSAQAARILGFEPVFVAELALYQGDERRQLRELGAIDSKTRTVEEIIHALGDALTGRIAAVTTFCDVRLPIAFDVAQRLGCAGLDPTVGKLKDKSFVAELMPEHSPKSLLISEGSPDWERVNATFSKERALVLKPVSAAGALGFRAIAPHSHLQSAIEEAFRRWTLPEINAGRWLLQERAPGAVFSVEGFVHDDRVHWLGFTGRGKVGSTESMLTFPADHEIDPGASEAAKSVVQKLLDRSGFSRGHFHVEFMIEGSQVWLIDANMGRMGGGPLAEMLGESFGIDPVRVFAHAISIGLGLGGVEFADFSRERVPTLGILYGTERETLLRDVRLPPEWIGVRHTELLEPGAVVPAMGTDDLAWIGILSGRPDAVMSAISQIAILSDRGWEAPCFR